MLLKTGVIQSSLYVPETFAKLDAEEKYADSFANCFLIPEKDLAKIDPNNIEDFE